MGSKEEFGVQSLNDGEWETSLVCLEEEHRLGGEDWVLNIYDKKEVERVEMGLLG